MQLHGSVKSFTHELISPIDHTNREVSSTLSTVLCTSAVDMSGPKKRLGGSASDK